MNSDTLGVLTVNEQAQLGAFEDALLSELAGQNVDEDEIMLALENELSIAANSIKGTKAVGLAKSLASELPPRTLHDLPTKGHRAPELSEISQLIDRHYLQSLVFFCLLYFGPELKDAIRRLTSLGVQIGENFKGDANFDNAREQVQAKIKDNSGD